MRGEAGVHRRGARGGEGLDTGAVVQPYLVKWSATWQGRLTLTVGVMFLGLLGYFLVNGLRPARLDLYTPVDHAIPFVPATLVLYHSYYILPLAVAVAAEPAHFLRMVRAAVPVVVVTFVCFLFVPAEFPRPAWEAAGPRWGPAFQWLHTMDGPANTFPSLHVAITALAWACTWRWRTRWFWTAWATLVVLSTLTTKQHFVADVVGGVVIALAANRWASR